MDELGPLRFVRGEEAPVDAIDRIYAAELDGVVWRGVIDAGECERIVTRFRTIDVPWERLFHDPRAPRTRGRMLSPDGICPHGPDLDDYFRHVERDTREFGHAFDDPDWPRSFLDPLARIAGGRVARVMDRPRRHRFATLRELGPGYGAMLHVDTYQRAPAFEHLHEHTDRRVQLSWYLVLQNPDEGGTLRIYTTRRGETKGAMDATGGPAVAVPLGVGDMILFDGANLYHEITPSVGVRARQTLGGFGGRGRDGESFFLWS